MSASLLFFAADAATVAFAGLLAVRMLLAFPGNRTAQIIAALAVSAVCHVILGRADYAPWTEPALRIEVGRWRPALNLGRNLAPALFMVLAHRLFTDRRWPPPWGLALVAVQLLLEEPARLLGNPDAPPGRLLTQTTPTLLQLLFAGLALYWTLADWRADLVEGRRRARVAVMAILAVNVVASSLLLRVILPWNSIANYQAHLALGLTNLAVSAFVVLRSLDPSVLGFLEPAPAAPIGGPPPLDPGALPRLKALLETDRIYRQPGLSLKGLAHQARLPEYRLRRLIHEALGFRNFNAFVHSYRIAEAKTRLADPTERRTPILTIGLEVGYQSINTFNRAFRTIEGQTPSAWRAAALGEGAPTVEPSPETA